MNLPGFLGKKNDGSPEAYFGLFLRGSNAVGFLFEAEAGTANLIAKEIRQYSSGWEAIVDDIDELLAVLENETGIRVTQTIFFLFSSFIDQQTQEIRDPYRKTLKQLTRELELKPLGFIECHEAVKDMIEKEEESVLNGVIVELDEHHAAVFVCKGGKIIHADSSPRTDSLGDDLQELFQSKKEQYLLPSRMIVYGSIAQEDLSELKSYQWNEELFIQTPRINALSAEQVLNGLSAAFLMQLTGGLTAPEEHAPHPVAELPPEPEPEQQPSVAARRTDGNHAFDDEPDDAEQVGFVVNEDIATLDVSPPQMSKQKKFRFAIPAIAFPRIPFPSASKSSAVETASRFESDESAETDREPTGARIRNSLPSFGGGGMLKVAVVAAVLMLVVGGLGAAEYYLHQATITVTLPSETVSEELTLSAPVTAALSDGLSIQKESQPTVVQDSVKTSGEREVGEKASGTVVVHNFDDAAVTFEAGTTISVDGRSYTLDSSVTVASASERIDDGVVKEPGTSSVAVTAAEIGDEYNVGDDTRFQIANRSSSTFFALSEGSISGGSKETLRTIAQNDIDQLSDLIASAKEKSGDVKGVATDGRILLEDLTQVEVTKETYSGEVGQEAEEVSVDAETTQTLYFLTEETLRSRLQEELGGSAPDGYRIDADTIDFKLREAEADGDSSVELKVSAEAVIIRDVNTDELIGRISGNSVDAAEDILKREYDAVQVEVTDNSTPVFFLSSMLPFDQSRIAFTFESE